MTLPRRMFAGLLAVLVAIPVMPAAAAAQPAPEVVGTLASGKSVILGQSFLQPGATVFSGDVIRVDSGGAALIMIAGQSMVRIAADSQVRLEKSGASVQVEVLQGSALLRSTPQFPVRGLLADAVVEAANGGAASASISIKNSNAAVVGAEKGWVRVRTARDAKEINLREGQGVELALADDQQTPEEQKKERRRRGGGYWTTGRIAILTGAMIVAISLVAVSFRDDDLTRQQQQDLISPFRLP